MKVEGFYPGFGVRISWMLYSLYVCDSIKCLEWRFCCLIFLVLISYIKCTNLSIYTFFKDIFYGLLIPRRDFLQNLIFAKIFQADLLLSLKRWLNVATFLIEYIWLCHYSHSKRHVVFRIHEYKTRCTSS